MGFLSSLFGADKSSDPLSKLDPKLRDFLEKESPSRRASQQQPQKSTPSDSQSHADPTVPESVSDKPAAPAASLYQDGRYAHLWKGYRPLAQIEAETATERDKLMGIIEDFKERKGYIGRAAMENCALQQEEWLNCLKSGSWEDRMQMCRHQVRRFERCYAMQSRFLRVLGHGSVFNRDPAVDEDIQMHADSLYNRILKHEEAVEQAKKDGTPLPVFELVLPKAKVDIPTPTENVAKQWKAQLDRLPEDERALEEAALRADLQAKSEMAKHFKAALDTQKEDRTARISEGRATLVDRLASMLTGK